MLFKRRNPVPVTLKVVSFLWPKIGLFRAAKYYALRIKRIDASPHAIAAGFACGAAVSFTPFVGSHIILSILLAKLMRASLISAVIGTVVGNPWSFPIIWVFIYKLGFFIINIFTQIDYVTKTELIIILKNVVTSVKTLDFRMFFEQVWPVFSTMLVGGIPTSIIAWFAFFIPIKQSVKAFRKSKKLRIELRKLQLKKNSLVQNKIKPLVKKLNKKNRKRMERQKIIQRDIRRKARKFSRRKILTHLNRRKTSRAKLARLLFSVYRISRTKGRRQLKARKAFGRRTRLHRKMRRILGSRR